MLQNGRMKTAKKRRRRSRLSAAELNVQPSRFCGCRLSSSCAAHPQPRPLIPPSVRSTSAALKPPTVCFCCCCCSARKRWRDEKGGVQEEEGDAQQEGRWNLHSLMTFDPRTSPLLHPSVRPSIHLSLDGEMDKSPPRRQPATSHVAAAAASVCF